MEYHRDADSRRRADPNYRDHTQHGQHGKPEDGIDAKIQRLDGQAPTPGP